MSSSRVFGFIAIGLIAAEIVALVGIMHYASVTSAASPRLADETNITRELMLTDLCLVTESRHTRNMSQVEPIAPFQDVPGFYDHFPSSTFLQPQSQIGEPRR
jgi:hypothetical protein